MELVSSVCCLLGLKLLCCRGFWEICSHAQLHLHVPAATTVVAANQTHVWSGCRAFLYCGGGGGGGGGTSGPATICFITRVKTQPDGDSAAHPLLSCAQETD